MKTRGVPEPHRSLESQDAIRTLTRIPSARTPATSIPLYSMSDAEDYDYHQSDRRNQLIPKLLRRKFLIAGAALLGALAGLGIALMSTPVYRATTSMQFEGFDDTLLRNLRQLPPMFPNGPPESYIRNQVKLLQSESLALRVANRLGIKSKASAVGKLAMLGMRYGLIAQKQLSAEQQGIATVQTAMKVRTTPQTQVVEVQYDSANADSAALGANTVVAEFIALNQEARWQTAQDTAEWLTKQTSDLKTKVEIGNHALQEFARSSGLAFAGNHNTLIEDRMRQLQDTLTKAETDRATKFARYEATLSSDTEGLPDLVATGPLRQYQSDLQGLRRELADLRAIYKPAYYKVLRVEAQIASLELAISTERQALMERLRNEYDVSARLEGTLRQKYALDLREAQDVNEKENRYNLLKREVESTQQLYESMLQKVKEASVTSALRATNVHVLDLARAPSSPHSPNLPIYVLVGWALGSLGGVGLVLYREPSDRVSTPDDACLLNVPLLGVIPSARHDRGLAGSWPGLMGGKRRNGNLALVTWQQEGSLLSESFRTTLASILLGFPHMRGGQPQGRAVVITSREPCEGKTTVLTNLGIALAETDRRVLLIDADLRRPALHQYFGISNQVGLSDLLQKPHLIEAPVLVTIAQETRVPNLWVLPSGPLVDGFPKLLYSAHLTRLLRRVRWDFDLILIDTPPMALYPESRVIGRISDGVVVVVRANRTRRDELKSTYLRFVQDNIPILGTILNDWRIEKGEHPAYGEHYRRYDRPRRPHVG